MDLQEPQVLEPLVGKDIVSISSCNYHNLALSSAGVLWAWGKNTWGQCGTGSDNVAVLPTVVEFDGDEPVVVEQAECGGYHSIVLSSAGDVYTWGRNTFGQLGAGNLTQYNRPILVETLRGKGVTQVRAGRSFSLALDEKGLVYSWGLGVHGQLGHGNAVNYGTPKIIATLSGLSCALLVCGNRHCCAMTDDGEVYFWGQGAKEQVLVMIPTRIIVARCREFRRLDCGGLHTLALTASGEVFSWGDGSYGQLGHSSNPNKPSPSSPDPKPIAALAGHHVALIAAGFYSSFALTDEGEVYAWGCNPRQVQSARLKLGSCLFSIQASATPQLVPCLSNRGVVALACGYEHYVALAERKPEPEVWPSLQLDLSKALNDPRFSDTTLVVEGRDVFCHRVVLASRCPHFERLFSSGMQEALPPYRVEVSDYKFPAFFAFLEFLYSERTDFSPEICLELLDITHQYGAPALKTACAQSLMATVSMDNVIQLFATGDQFQAVELKQSCLHFIVDHLNELISLESFATLSKECYLDILKFASQKNMSFEKRIPMPRRGQKRRLSSTSNGT
eukprot:GGOE01041385.1.p1 GENE.GGOE01041385.1~~GGOE01041385.1.p1  ORF type:complete len:562 (-),score=144.02 GGOE01041385.1:105-1790(-)